MNIEQARDVYQKFGSALNPDFEEWAKVFRRLAIEEPISNSNFLHALSLTDLMFCHTSRSLDMVTGDLGDGFVQCLQASFTKMLDRIRAAGGKARIIVIDGDAKLLRQMASGVYRGVLEVAEATLRPDAVVRHFIVGDDDMVRDEEPHAPLTNTTDANVVRADVYFHNKSMARVFSSRFGAMWSALSGK